MPTLMQKIRLALRGWNRRREEKNRAFIESNVSGPASAGPPGAGRLKAVHSQIDREGLAVAYLDESGRTTYYLDAQTGDVIESNVALDSARYKAVPLASHEQDRQAFLFTVEDAADRTRLTPAESFRAILARNRALEKAWYNFRNDRAIEAIERWLREIGIQ